jgi:hypothetical protein
LHRAERERRDCKATSHPHGEEEGNETGGKRRESRREGKAGRTREIKELVAWMDI